MQIPILFNKNQWHHAAFLWHQSTATHNSSGIPIRTLQPNSPFRFIYFTKNAAFSTNQSKPLFAKNAPIKKLTTKISSKPNLLWPDVSRLITKERPQFCATSIFATSRNFYISFFKCAKLSQITIEWLAQIFTKYRFKSMFESPDDLFGEIHFRLVAVIYLLGNWPWWRKLIFFVDKVNAIFLANKLQNWIIYTL